MKGVGINDNPYRKKKKWETIFERHIAKKVLLYKYVKNSNQSERKNSHTNRKCAKDMDRRITEG